MANRKYKNAVQARKARNRVVDKYHNRAMKSFSFRFHKVSDRAVIERIQQKENKNDYIRQLILADIQKEEE